MYKKIKTELKKYEGLSFIERELYIHKEKLLDLYKYGMVLIGPDAFIQNDVLDILAFFENNGFKLVDLRLKQLNRTQTETLFLPTSSCVKCDNLKWWMIQDSAYQGVFCSAIFYCEDAEVTDNCLKMLNELKGKSNPLDNAPGVVRYDYAAINVCLNLIHIPDIYGDFFKDITPFYKISEIIDIINGNFIQYRSLKNKIFEIKLLKKMR